MLKTSYTLNIGQVLKIAPKLKRYLWQKFKLDKTQNVSKTTTNKQAGSLVLEVGINVVTINKIIWQIGKNTIEDVMLNGGSRVNIITK
jgi:hypothetical protein